MTLLRVRALLGLALGWALLAVSAAADELASPDRSIPEVIDHYVEGQLTRLKIPAAAQASDAELVRRLALDLVGRVPTVAEAQAYVQSSSPNKREELVDRFLQLPEFAFHQRNELDLMLAGEERLDNRWRSYLLKAAQENRPWDEMFREMLLTEESEQSPGALALLKAKAKDVDRMTGDISSLFFGVNITCAKCHDHPLVSDWLQDHYFGFQSFFNRTYVNKANFLGEYDEGDVKFKTTSGESKSAQLMFLTGTVVNEPAPPARSEAEKKKLKETLAELEKNKQPIPAPQFSRREALVELSLAPGERDFFAKSIVNRMWHRMLGWGLVNPVDQMHSGNPPTHPQLLEWLARDLVAHKYDLKRLIRGIALSQAYSRSSVWNQEGDRPYRDSFAVANVKPLTPRQLGMALQLATASPEWIATYTEGEKWNSLMSRNDDQAGNMASNVEAPTDDFQVSVSEALFFSNNERILSDYLGSAKEKLVGYLANQPDRQQALQTAGWSVYSRPLTEQELQLLNQYLDDRSDRLEDGWKQLVWALITSPEFRFNH